MEEFDLAKLVAARAMANGVDEARATRMAAELAPLLACLHMDEKEMLMAEPAVVFRPGRVTPSSGSA